MELAVAAATALWLGILTSVSPCPLATNVAAISYIGRRVSSTRQVLLTGLLYTLGRTLSYLVLAVVLVATALSVPQISLFLQKYMHVVLGPILSLVGMVLLGLIRISLGGGSGVSEGTQKRVDAWGIWGALLLGIVFALSFCPTSAFLYFGGLIPLSLEVQSSVALPAIYGVGKAFNVLSKIEWWARMLTGGIFVLVGVYFALAYIFEVI
jgi:cytochrome c-type biogenesis protein